MVLPTCNHPNDSRSLNISGTLWDSEQFQEEGLNSKLILKFDDKACHVFLEHTDFSQAHWLTSLTYKIEDQNITLEGYNSLDIKDDPPGTPPKKTTFTTVLSSDNTMFTLRNLEVSRDLTFTKN
jgi:hypothetical protein